MYFVRCCFCGQGGFPALPTLVLKIMEEFEVGREELDAIIEELETWLPSETEEFVELVMRILASLPGGEEVEDLGYRPLCMGWKEVELLRGLLSVLNGPEDVQYVSRRLLRELTEDTENEE